MFKRKQRPFAAFMLAFGIVIILGGGLYAAYHIGRPALLIAVILAYIIGQAHQAIIHDRLYRPRRAYRLPGEGADHEPPENRPYAGHNR